MALTITYIDIRNHNESELAVTSNSGRRWNVYHYNGEYGMYGWIPKTYIDFNPMRPDISFDGLPELLKYLMHDNIHAELIAFWKETE